MCVSSLSVSAALVRLALVASVWVLVALVGSVSKVHKAVNKNTNRKLGPLSVIGFASTCTALVHEAYGSADGGVMMNHSTHVSNRVIGGIMMNALVNVN